MNQIQHYRRMSESMPIQECRFWKKQKHLELKTELALGAKEILLVFFSLAHGSLQCGTAVINWVTGPNTYSLPPWGLGRRRWGPHGDVPHQQRAAKQHPARRTSCRSDQFWSWWGRSRWWETPVCQMRRVPMCARPFFKIVWRPLAQRNTPQHALTGVGTALKISVEAKIRFTETMKFVKCKTVSAWIHTHMNHTHE